MDRDHPSPLPRYWYFQVRSFPDLLPKRKSIELIDIIENNDRKIDKLIKRGSRVTPRADRANKNGNYTCLSLRVSNL